MFNGQGPTWHRKKSAVVWCGKSVISRYAFDEQNCILLHGFGMFRYVLEGYIIVQLHGRVPSLDPADRRCVEPQS